MRIQNIAVTNEGVQITYLEESDIDERTGIIEAHVLDIRHDALPHALLEELIDSAQTIIEHARVLRRKPIEEFRANR